MPKRRILLVGAGRWGQVLIRNLAGHSRLHLAGIVTSQQPENLGLLQEEVTFHQNLEGALNGSWDGVILASPPDVHRAQLLSCIEAGIPCLVEKPLTLSEIDARELEERARQASIPVLVDHLHLFHSGYEWLKQRVPPLQVLSIRSEGGNFGPFRQNYSALWDYGAHDVALILDLLQSFPKKVEAYAENVENTDGGLAGEYSVRLEFNSGQSASFSSSNRRRDKVRTFHVETEEFSYLLEDAPFSRLTRKARASDILEQIPLPSEKPLERLLHVFADGLEGKFDGRWGVGLGAKVIRCLESCERSLRSWTQA